MATHSNAILHLYVTLLQVLKIYLCATLAHQQSKKKIEIIIDKTKQGQALKWMGSKTFTTIMAKKHNSFPQSKKAQPIIMVLKNALEMVFLCHIVLHLVQVRQLRKEDILYGEMTQISSQEIYHFKYK